MHVQAYRDIVEVRLAGEGSPTTAQALQSVAFPLINDSLQAHGRCLVLTDAGDLSNIDWEFAAQMGRGAIRFLTQPVHWIVYTPDGQLLGFALDIARMFGLKLYCCVIRDEVETQMRKLGFEPEPVAV